MILQLPVKSPNNQVKKTDHKEAGQAQSIEPVPSKSQSLSSTIMASSSNSRESLVPPQSKLKVHAKPWIPVN